MKKFRILLADEQVLVRAGIRSLLGRLPGAAVLAEASDGREAVELALSYKPDIAMLETELPKLNGLQTARSLRRKFPQIGIIFLSTEPSDEYVDQAIKLGASGYLLKKSAVVELEAAIRSVLKQNTYISPAIIRVAKPRKASGTQGSRMPPEKLTPLQRAVLKLIAESRTTKEIALELGISAKTVEFHRSELMKCLKIFDVPGLVRYALRSGVAESES